jgi:hypothetical protein
MNDSTGNLQFIINGISYELVESDMDPDAHYDGFGYDIYEGDNPNDPINLGQIVYFDRKPTQKDVEKWLSDFRG